MHIALQLWSKENNSSVSALVINQLKQDIQFCQFEILLRKLETIETPQDTVNALQNGRDDRRNNLCLMQAQLSSVLELE